MDNNSNFGESEWYEARKDNINRDYEDAPMKRRRTPWRIFGVIVLIIVVIAGSSMAFSHTGSSFSFTWNNNGKQGSFSWGDFDDNVIPWFDQSGDDNTEMPDSAEDFFDSFYTKTDTTNVTTQINIPTLEEKVDFQIKLEDLPEERLSLGQIYEDCSSSVVAIYAYVDDNPGFFWGTGIVLSEDGLILTNTHIIDGCDRVTVKLNDNAEFDAKLVGADAVSDIAVLHIECATLKPAKFGKSSLLKVGDEVASIGNPLGEQFRLTLTNGIISAIDRGMNYKGRTMNLLQTNTAINSGNSGGALFNMYGQVIGVTNMKMMSSYDSIEGIGFAIPSSTISDVVNSLIKYGKIVGRPSIGITIGEIPEYAIEKYNMPDGVYVAEVQENSDAAKKGIKKGDVITEVNYIPVTTVEEVSNIKNTLAVDDIMIFKIWRDGETSEVEIILMETNDIY